MAIHRVYACSHPQAPVPNAPFTPLPIPGVCRDCHLAETRRAEAAIKALFDWRIAELTEQIREGKISLWRSWNFVLEREIEIREKNLRELTKTRDEAITEHWTDFGGRWGYGWW